MKTLLTALIVATSTPSISQTSASNWSSSIAYDFTARQICTLAGTAIKSKGSLFGVPNLVGSWDAFVGTTLQTSGSKASAAGLAGSGLLLSYELPKSGVSLVAFGAQAFRAGFDGPDWVFGVGASVRF